MEKDTLEASAKYEDAVSTNADLNDQNKKLKRQLVDIQNARINEKRKQYVDKKVRKWRQASLYTGITAVGIVALIPFSFALMHNWDFGYLLDKSKSGNLGIILIAIVGLLYTALSAIFFKPISEAFYSITAIDKFKQLLPIPNDLKEIPYED